MTTSRSNASSSILFWEAGLGSPQSISPLPPGPICGFPSSFSGYSICWKWSLAIFWSPRSIWSPIWAPGALAPASWYNPCQRHKSQQCESPPPPKLLKFLNFSGNTATQDSWNPAVQKSLLQYSNFQSSQTLACCPWNQGNKYSSDYFCDSSMPPSAFPVLQCRVNNS